VRSLPDGVAHVLDEYLQATEAEHDAAAEPAHSIGSNGNGSGPSLASGLLHEFAPHAEQPALLKIGDLCPECGQAAVVNEEGCRKCYSCGFSEC
jgi:ribonucleoside-diphosphate reductase alpha chain